MNAMIRSFIRDVAHQHQEGQSKAKVDGSGDCQCQIINLGCGFDTLSLRLLKEETIHRVYNESDAAAGEEGSSAAGRKVDLHIFEVDHADTIAQKASYLASEEGLTVEPLAPSPGFTSSSSSSSSQGYSVGIADVPDSCSLRMAGCDLMHPESVAAALLEAGLDPQMPTLVLTECVMVYMDKASCRNLCRTVMQGLLRGSAVWVSYDMVNVGDRYGQVMLRNLTQAGYKVPGFVDNPERGDHIELFETAAGAGESVSVSCRTMLECYKDEDMVSNEKKARVARLEIFDEIEEWEMIMSHYCITRAHRMGNATVFDGCISGSSSTAKK
jgi:O-methyltransferase involved in polyketide biosynthesis